MVLLLVGYSCLSSLFYVAFGPTENPALKIWDTCVEVIFITDLILNFLTDFVN